MPKTVNCLHGVNTVMSTNKPHGHIFNYRDYAVLTHSVHFYINQTKCPEYKDIKYHPSNWSKDLFVCLFEKSHFKNTQFCPFFLTVHIDFETMSRKDWLWWSITWCRFIFSTCLPKNKLKWKRNYVKSFETASMKFGADIKMVKVQIMEKSENATRQRRSTTAAANFHSLQMASASSWSRNLWAMYITSARMRWISCSPAYSLTASLCSSGDPPIRPPLHDTPESLLGGQQALSMEW